MEADTTVVVDTPAPTGMEAAMAAYDVATSDIPAAETSAEKSDDKVADKVDESVKTDEVRPAWVSWTDEGGFRVKPGKGFTIAEDGSVLFDPEVAQRMANKRVGRTREEERAAARHRIEEVERRYQAEIEALKKGGSTQAPTDKPWAAKGAAKPSMDDFESVEQWADARDEWKDAQAAQPDLQSQGAKPAKGSPPSDEASGPTEFDTAVRTLFEAGVERFEDFDAVAGPIELNEEVLRATMASDAAPDLLYYYGKHPEAADELNDLEGYPLIRAIATIEARMTTSAQPDSTPSTKPGITPPQRKEVTPVINPVRPGASPRRSLTDLAAADDADGFYKLLADELK